MKKANFLILTIILMFFALNTNIFANVQDSLDCPLPRHPDIKVISKGETLDIFFKDDRPPIYGVFSIKRETITKYGRLLQSIRVKRKNESQTIDTVLLLDDVSELKASSLGAGGQTLVVPVLAAREFYKPDNISTLKPNFLEARFQVGMFGNDESNSKSGFKSPLIGMSALVSPFGQSFGETINLSLGAGIFMESGRMRIPVFGNLRWTFMGAIREEEYYNYYPSPCKFGIKGESPIRPSDKTMEEVPAKEKVDSTVYFQKNRRLIKDKFRPFAFVEAGPILNGSFEGSGKEPAVNSNDYSQYYYSFGLGMPIFDYLVASLAYKYQRLNLRVPCQACNDTFILNTNVSQGLELGISLNLNY